MRRLYEDWVECFGSIERVTKVYKFDSGPGMSTIYRKQVKYTLHPDKRKYVQFVDNGFKAHRGDRVALIVNSKNPREAETPWTRYTSFVLGGALLAVWAAVMLRVFAAS